VSECQRLGRSRGKFEKRVRFQFEQAQASTLPFDMLIDAIRAVGHKVRTDNLFVTLEKMKNIGDVTLTKRKGKIRTVTLFDYSTKGHRKEP